MAVLTFSLWPQGRSPEPSFSSSSIVEDMDVSEKADTVCAIRFRKCTEEESWTGFNPNYYSEIYFIGKLYMMNEVRKLELKLTKRKANRHV